MSCWSYYSRAQNPPIVLTQGQSQTYVTLCMLHFAWCIELLFKWFFPEQVYVCQVIRGLHFRHIGQAIFHQRRQCSSARSGLCPPLQLLRLQRYLPLRCSKLPFAFSQSLIYVDFLYNEQFERRQIFKRAKVCIFHQRYTDGQ